MNYTYTPADMPEVTLDYEYDPGQPSTWELPGYPEHVIINDIKINGDAISEDLTDTLINFYCDTWEQEILTNIKQEQDYERAGI
jgi:hypothetical protein